MPINVYTIKTTDGQWQWSMQLVNSCR